jgi:precorrin-6Y C5,15-methyltransferase (decarboxylating)
MAEPSSPSGYLTIVGVHGGEWYGRRAGEAVAAAEVIVGSARHLEAVGETVAPKLAYRTLAELLDAVDARLADGDAVCVLASGDPGFFGAARVLAARYGPALQGIHPAPSSVALAFARAGLPWDDAVVVSAHGRDLDAGLPAVRAAAKAAVLTSPANPPEAVGRALAGAGLPTVWVASRLGQADESVVRTDLAGLTAGGWDPLSVVIVASTPVAERAALTWGYGRPVAAFEHRAGMITKPEVRAVVLGKLELHPSATLWDVGAGSGSVAVEAARSVPGLRAWAVERRADDCDRIRANAVDLPVTVVAGEAPRALEALPVPDRAFVGGGGLDVLDAVRARVGVDGVVVATFAALDRAAAAGARLGNLVQVAVSRATPIGPGAALRLVADNPVFVAWGTGTDAGGSST